MNSDRSSGSMLPIPDREILEDEPLTAALAPPIVVRAPVPDPTDEQVMRAIEVSGALDFWDRPEEDVYSECDGQPP